MCDTMVALGGLTASGRTTLAKNSDREPNEAQYLAQFPAAAHADGATVRCTYVEVAQAPRTYAVIGSQPWWIWGFEHGVNEKGLAIGNEAVWSRLPAGEEPGLLGMDLLRLTLERAADAHEALDVLTRLLEEHGQSGSASRSGRSFYHNNFILADGARAWVLQTAGRHWAAKRVEGWASISNVYSIGSDYDRISAGAVAFAVAQGWFDPSRGEPFSFAESYADLTLPVIPSCQSRFRLSQSGLGHLAAKGRIGLQQFFDLLRSHGAADSNPDWRPGGDGEGYLCMHATKTAGFETAASMVVELPAAGSGEPIACWASLASPCLSAFVPFWFDTGAPPAYARPFEGSRDPWWDQETMQRKVERDYAAYAGMVKALLRRLEAEALRKVGALSASASEGERRRISEEAAAHHVAIMPILDATLAELGRGPLPPRGADPRGGYLADAAASKPVTARPAH